MTMKHYCCMNCGFWQRRFAAPSTCPVCEDYRHPLPPDGYLFLTAEQIDAQQSVTIEPVLPGLTRYQTSPSIGIGSCGYLLEHPRGNLHFDGCGWYDSAALEHMRERGGVAMLAASHSHVFGGLWRVAEAFEPTTVFQDRMLNLCQAFRVTRPFDAAFNLHDPTGRVPDDPNAGDGLNLYLTAGHTPGHTVLHDPQRRWLFCGDALKFTFPKPGQTVGVADTVSCHKAYDSHIPLTHDDCRAYLTLFERLAFDVVITPWEVVTEGGRDGALRMLHAYLDALPSADPFPLAGVAGDRPLTPTPHH